MSEENGPGTKLASHADALTSLRYDAVRTKLVTANVTRFQRYRALLQVPSILITLGTLIAAEYPPVPFTCAIGSGSIGVFAMLWMMIRVKRYGFDPRVFRITQWLVYASSFCMVLSTGGFRSPVLPLFIIVGSLLDLPLGLPPLRISYALQTVIGLVLLILIPRAWVGPPLAFPHYEIIVANIGISLVFTVSAGLGGWAQASTEAGERLQRLREEVLNESTARARSLESISSKVAHELKNPLASIKGMAQLVERSLEDERAKTRLGVVVEEASRMEVILSEYLSFTRPLEDLRPQRIDVRLLVQDVLHVIEARAVGAKIALSLEGESAPITADPRRLKEAFLNFVSNAIQATPLGGSVSVKLMKTDDGVDVIVSDTGAGMNPEVLGKVGTPFFTTRKEGTGLGVVLARAAIAQHGGDVKYESSEGKGTTVTVHLPKEPKGAPHGPGPTHR